MKNFLATMLIMTTLSLYGQVPAATGSAEFKVKEPTPGKAVAAADFGFSPDRSGVENMKAMDAAIDYCRANHVRVLNLAPGTYRIGDYRDGKAGGPYSGRRRPHIMLRDLHNFCLDGHDARLLFQHFGHFIEIRNAEQVAVKNLVLDWDWSLEPLQSPVKVTGIDPAGDWMEVEFIGRKTLDFPFRDAEAQKRRFFELVQIDPHTGNPAEAAPSLVPGWWYFDAKTSRKSGDNRVVLVLDKHSSAYGRDALKKRQVKVGQYYLWRHMAYLAAGIEIQNARHITLDHLTIHSSLGAGISGKQLQYLRICNCRLTPPPERKYAFSSAADGLFILNFHGYFIFENNLWRKSGDDLLNLHNTISDGIKIVGDRQFETGNAIDWRNPFKAGDLINFRNPDATDTGLKAEVVGVRYLPGKKALITVKDKLPSLPAAGLVFNLRFNIANVIIRNNIFADNRGNGVVVSADNLTIANNRFEHNMYSAVRVRVSVGRWGEGYMPENVLIRNNEIIRPALSRQPNRFFQGIWIGVETDNGAVPPLGFPDLVTICGNRFRQMAGESIRVESSGNLRVVDNRLLEPEYSSFYPRQADVVINRTSTKTVENNTGMQIAEDPKIMNP